MRISKVLPRKTADGLKSAVTDHKTSIADFSSRGDAKALWEELRVDEAIHKEPSSRRFLGSARIDPTEAKRLIETVGANFCRLSPFSSCTCSKEYDVVDPEGYWCRLTTLALTEFAYQSDDIRGFWTALQEHMGLPVSQLSLQTFQEILRRGFRYLDLVKAKGVVEDRNLYVSTLNLQNGVPVKHQQCFATLLGELRDEYGWWEIAHASPEAVAQLLLNHCTRHHRGWLTIKRFLEMSCPKDDQPVHPLSGELTSSLATIATELDRRGLDARVLANNAERERVLAGFDLPHAFFLRDWASLVPLLRFNPKPVHGRRIRLMRSQPPKLRMDPNDWEELTLVLPPQQVNAPEWKALSSGYGVLEPAGAEFDIDILQGVLDIPMEVSYLVKEAPAQCNWDFRLGSQDGSVAYSWSCQGPDPDRPVLIFDPLSGERLDPGAELGDAQEVVLFTPRQFTLLPSDDIQVIERVSSCSLRGWHGFHVEKVSAEACLRLCSSDIKFQLEWCHQDKLSPELRGARLLGRQQVFTIAPKLWIPPLEESATLRLRIEDLDNRSWLTRDDEVHIIPRADAWQAIDLDAFLTHSGRYSIVILVEEDHETLPRRWQQQLRLELDDTANDLVGLSQLTIQKLINPPIIEPVIQAFNTSSTPERVDDPANFWLSVWKVSGLWPFEQMRVEIRNGESSHSFLQAATARGEVVVETSILRYSLEPSDWYQLSLQRIGDAAAVPLAVLGEPEAESITWDCKSGELGGLRSGVVYELHAWNLLTPERPSQRIAILAESPLMLLELEKLLPDPEGIFVLELFLGQQRLRQLGWWSGLRDQHDLVPIGADSALLEQLLHGAPVEDFPQVAKDITPTLPRDRLQEAISNLKNNKTLQPWIDSSRLALQLMYWAQPSDTAGSPSAELKPPGHRGAEGRRGSRQRGPRRGLTYSLRFTPPVTQLVNKIKLHKDFEAVMTKLRQAEGIPADVIRVQRIDHQLWIELDQASHKEDLDGLIVAASEMLSWGIDLEKIA
ncbi:hypothetical protein [Synechococcus sp. 1G10]|uniref:hypothetical protein n=1 Tax=Synechococcus sp. 1G10 TaxID=2025605 RepID=UPI00117EC5B5|nr:hypothetical protein [Synechococcus sp. 1G10]